MQAAHTLTHDRISSAAELLCAAFFSNPAHVYIFPRPETRAARLRWLLAANLRLHLDPSWSFCLSKGPVVQAMGFWTKSTSPKPAVAHMLRAGILAAPLRIGPTALQRSLNVSRALERDVERELGNRPFWYLNNMAIEESSRGRGIGSRLLDQQLRAVRKHEPSYEIVLSTQRPKNVAFYQRLGFVPVRESVVGDDPGAFRNWTMLYAPAA